MDGNREEMDMPLDGTILQRLRTNDPTLTVTARLLNSQAIGDDGAIDVAAALTINTTVVSLSLNSNGITDRGMPAVAQIFKSNTTIKVLELNNNSITAKGLGFLTGVLISNKSLTMLSVQTNPVGLPGVKLLAEVLKKNKSLTTLRIQRNAIGDVGATDIAVSLYKNKTLTSLGLSHNDIGDVGVKALAAPIKVSTSLSELRLNNNSISDAGAKDIADAILVNSSLTVIMLSQNRIKDIGARALLDALEINNSIITLSLDGNDISVALLGEIEKKLQRNRRDAVTIESLQGAIRTGDADTAKRVLQQGLGTTNNKKILALLCEEACSGQMMQQWLRILLTSEALQKLFERPPASVEVHRLIMESDVDLSGISLIPWQRYFDKDEQEKLELRGAIFTLEQLDEISNCSATNEYDRALLKRVHQSVTQLLVMWRQQSLMNEDAKSRLDAKAVQYLQKCHSELSRFHARIVESVRLLKNMNLQAWQNGELSRSSHEAMMSVIAESIWYSWKNSSDAGSVIVANLESNKVEALTEWWFTNKLLQSEASEERKYEAYLSNMLIDVMRKKPHEVTMDQSVLYNELLRRVRDNMNKKLETNDFQDIEQVRKDVADDTLKAGREGSLASEVSQRFRMWVMDAMGKRLDWIRGERNTELCMAALNRLLQAWDAKTLSSEVREAVVKVASYISGGTREEDTEALRNAAYKELFTAWKARELSADDMVYLTEVLMRPWQAKQRELESKFEMTLCFATLEERVMRLQQQLDSVMVSRGESNPLPRISAQQCSMFSEPGALRSARSAAAAAAAEENKNEVEGCDASLSQSFYLVSGSGPAQ